MLIRPGVYKKIMLLNALYCPRLDINLISSLKHYKAGGYLNRDTIYNNQRQPIGLLDPKNTGFFLPLKGFKTPQAHITSYMASYMAYSSIEVRLPAISEDKAKEYILFSNDNIDLISSVDTISS